MWIKVLSVTFALLVFAVLAIYFYGRYRWRTETDAMRTRMQAAKRAHAVRTYDVRELDALPAPVQRYFRAALTPNQPMVAAVDINITGAMRMSDDTKKWSAFTSNQRVITQRAGFDWNASITMFPGINAYVHDAYIAGEGILHAALLGAFTVADMRGTKDSAHGEFMRFVAECAWYPTRMLPSQGATWTAVDDTSATLTISDGETSATLLVRFGADNLIASIRAEARGRLIKGVMSSAPWQGRFWDYAEHDGMRVPQQGEVAWVLPESAEPYWRGRVTSVRYEFESAA
jgi:hypothetical protein